MLSDTTPAQPSPTYPAPGTLTLTLSELEAFDPMHPRKPGETRCCCPLCGPGKPVDKGHRSFAYNGQTGVWNCHRCGQKGLLKEFWTERPKPDKSDWQGGGMRRRNARAALSRFSLVALPPLPAPLARTPPLSAFATRPPAASSPPVVTPAPTAPVAAPSPWREKMPALLALTDAKAQAGAGYLAGRGLPADFVHAQGVRFARSYYGKPAIMFSVRGERGQLVAVQGRFTNKEATPKARSAGERKQGVFLTPGALSVGGAVVFTEAPIDALSLAYAGLPALALCGSKGIPEWLLRACAFRDSQDDRGVVVAAFDADTAGDEAAATLTALLRSYGARVVRVVPPGGAKDWNEALQASGVEAIRAVLQECDLPRSAPLDEPQTDPLTPATLPASSGIEPAAPVVEPVEELTNPFADDFPGALTNALPALLTTGRVSGKFGSNLSTAVLSPAEVEALRAAELEEAETLADLEAEQAARDVESLGYLYAAALAGNLPTEPVPLGPGRVCSDPARFVLRRVQAIKETKHKRTRTGPGGREVWPGWKLGALDTAADLVTLARWWADYFGGSCLLPG